MWVYDFTWKYNVGPRGNRHSLRLTETSVLENIAMWLTFNGPAMATKSFKMFFLLTCDNKKVIQCGLQYWSNNLCPK